MTLARAMLFTIYYARPGRLEKLQCWHTHASTPGMAEARFHRSHPSALVAWVESHEGAPL